MLVPMKAKTKATVDEVLENVGIHVIRLNWNTLCVVVPHSDSNALTVSTVSQSKPRLGDTSWMDPPLLVEYVVVGAATETNERQIELGVVEHVKVLSGIKRVFPSTFVKRGVQIAESFKAAIVHLPVSNLE